MNPSNASKRSRIQRAAKTFAPGIAVAAILVTSTGLAAVATASSSSGVAATTAPTATVAASHHTRPLSTVGKALAAKGATVRRAVKGTHYAKIVPACALPSGHRDTCFALRRVAATAKTPGALRYKVQAAYPVGLAGGYTPSDLWTAYNLGDATSLTAADGPGSSQTIGIVDAYNDPNIAADLAAFDTAYDLPACTTASGGCLTIRGEDGSTNLPDNVSGTGPSKGWDQEISLDVETAHAVCPNCKIVLVEANAATNVNLGTAANSAANLGATVISNSYGGAEAINAGVQADYAKSNVVETASAGDQGYYNWTDPNLGYAANTPAAFPNVIAVGGTNLKLNSDGSRASEGVWNDKVGPNASDRASGGTGGGCSLDFTRTPFQGAMTGYTAAGCASNGRLVSDVSALGDPVTGFDMYDTYSTTGWNTVGGTSLSSPIVAAMFALAGGAQNVIPARTLYTDYTANPGGIYDVTVGGNGSCGGTCTSPPAPTLSDCNSTSACDAETGFDGPSGVGTPIGLNDLNPVLADFQTTDQPDLSSPVSVDASASSATATGEPITSYQWNWGDGSASTTTTAQATHTYTAEGKFTITLTASTSGTDGGSATPVNSLPVTQSVLVGHPLPANQNAPTIGGTARDLQTLTAQNGTWTKNPTTFDYSWQRCDAAAANCVPIPSSSSQTYRLLDADVGHTIEAVETATNAAGTSAPATSLPSAVVAAVPAPNTGAYSFQSGSAVNTPGGSSAAFSPSGNVLAVVAGHGVATYTVGAGGTFTPVTGSPFTADEPGVLNNPSFLAFSPNGQFLAVSDVGGFGGIAMFSVSSTGVLTAVSGSPFILGAYIGGPYYAQAVPSQLSWSPDGGMLATVENRSEPGYTAAVDVFSISATGVPNEISGSPLTTTLANPWTATFSPSGQFLAVTANQSSQIDMLSVSDTDTFARVTGSPFTLDGTGPTEVVFSPGGGLLAVPTSTGVGMYTVSTAGALAEVGTPFTSPSANVNTVFFSPAGGLLAVSSAYIDQFSQPTGSSVATYSYTLAGAVTQLTGSPYSDSANCSVSGSCRYGLGAFSADGSLIAMPNLYGSSVDVYQQAAPPGAPSAPTNVTATAGNAQATVSWTAAAANGSTVTGYTVTSSPDGKTCSTTGATQCTVTGLTNGTAYTFTVVATNGVGPSTASGPSNSVTPTAPTAPSAPTNVTASAGNAQATVSWTASSANGSAITGYTVTSSPDGKTCSTAGTTTCAVTGLSNGTAYTFTVVASNGVGPSTTSSPSNSVTPTAPAPPPADTTAPSITVPALPTYTFGSKVGIVYAGTDNKAVANYDVRYLSASLGHGFGQIVSPSSWQSTTSKVETLPVHAGTTYCFSARSRDTSGNVSAWSAFRCTAAPVDDRGLKAGHGWKRAKGHAYFDGTVTSTSKKGSVLSVKVVAKRIALIASKCSSCGRVGVYEGGKLLKSINLKGRTANRVVISVATFSTNKAGTITIKSLTKKKSIKIDGLAVSAI